ncbi:MAG: alpha/beta fold hydrolase, partial [Gammaproteobacteria bacterium]
QHTTLNYMLHEKRPDHRRHGESFTRGKVSLIRWCEDLIALLDKEGYSSAALVGHSLGAQVAMAFAARYSERTEGMVLIDPLLSGALRGRARWIRRLTPLIASVVAIVRLLNRLGLYRRAIPIRDLRRLDDETRAQLLAAGKQEEMIGLYASPWADLEYFPTANYLQELIEVTRPLPPLAEVNIPTLVLLSRGATFTDPGTTAGLLKPLAHVEIHAVFAHHWPITESPVEVRRAIEDWLYRRFL